MIIRELSLAARRLRRAPVFAACAFLSIAAGIGINTTAFAFLDSAINPVQPVPEAENVWLVAYPQSNDPTFAQPDRLEALRSARGVVEEVAALRIGTLNGGVVAHSSGAHVPTEVIGVSPAYWRTLRVRPTAGRLFGVANDADERAAVITEALWVRLRGTSSSFEPFAVTVNDTLLTVIGVVPKSALYPRGPDLVRAVNPSLASTRYLVRLAGSSDPTRQAQRLAEHATRVSGARPERVALEPAFSRSGRARAIHVALLVAALSLLLLTCANISAIQADRATSREHELLIRHALGATRAEIIATLVSEVAIVGLLGGVAGLFSSLFGVKLLQATLPPSLATLGLVVPHLSWRALFWGEILVIATLVLIGLAPAWRSSAALAAGSLQVGHSTTLSRRVRQRSQLIVAAEVAGALTLLVLAMLLAATARHLTTLDVGYEPARLITVGVQLRTQRVPEAPHGLRSPMSRSDQRAVTADDVDSRAIEARVSGLTHRIRNISGVQSVAPTYFVGLEQSTITTTERDGRVVETVLRRVNSRIVSPEFPATLSMTLVRGSLKEFSVASRPAVAIIDETAAHELWPGRDPLGQMLKLGDASSSRPWVRVVGITRRVALLAADCLTRECFIPSIFVRDIDIRPYGNDAGRFTEMLVRVNSQIAPIQQTLQRGTWLDSPSTLYAVDAWSNSNGFNAMLERHRIIAIAFVAFAIAGIGLAALGAFAVVAQGVGRRRKEFGVRLAMGAKPGDLVRLVIRESSTVALLGIAAGLLLSVWAERIVAALLFEAVDLWAWAYFAIAAVTVAAAVLIASYVPALRAAKLDPAVVLRAD